MNSISNVVYGCNDIMNVPIFTDLNDIVLLQVLSCRCYRATMERQHNDKESVYSLGICRLQ